VICDISLSRQFRLNSLGPCWDSSVFAKVLKAIFGWLHENLKHTSPKMAKILLKFVIILLPKHKIQPKCSTSFLRCLLPTVHFSTCYLPSFWKLRIFSGTTTIGHCLETFRTRNIFLSLVKKINTLPPHNTPPAPRSILPASSYLFIFICTEYFDLPSHNNSINVPHAPSS